MQLQLHFIRQVALARRQQRGLTVFDSSCHLPTCLTDAVDGLCSMYCCYQRWSRGHKARGQGQGHKKNPRTRPRTAFPRTDTLEAKDRNTRGQGQGPRTQAQVLSKKKRTKRSSQKFFRRSPKKKKKKVFTKIFQAISTKNVFQKIFQPLHKILIIQKIMLSSSRGQANFRGLEASRPRPRT